MADSSEFRRNDSIIVIPFEVTRKLMVIAVVVFFMVLFFVLFLHFCANCFRFRREEAAAAASPPTQRRRRSATVSGDIEPSSTSLSLGLDPSVLRFIPVVIFSPKEFREGLECSVCLSDVSEGDEARILPKCNHGFHVDCIDMWFKSHSTCPLCRNPVLPQSSSTSNIPQIQSSSEFVSGYSLEIPNYPTNVLFWGNQTGVSTLGPCLDEDNQNPVSSQPPGSSSSSSSTSSARPDGMLAIDIPRQMNEEEEPKLPITTRLRSLKRLLSRDSKVGHCSSSDVSVEQADRTQ